MPPAKKSKSKSSRFPVARIKKIMQMDEEIGKLASATPVMISKALECFIQMLVEESSNTARTQGSKKVTPQHLKSTVTSQPNFDFLLGQVENVPDGVAGPSRSGNGAGTGTGDGVASGGEKRKGKRKATKDEYNSDAYDSKPARSTGAGGGGKGAKKNQGGAGRGQTGQGQGQGQEATEEASLPQIGTWKREMTGAGGTGEGGRGMFDDYEDDDDEYDE